MTELLINLHPLYLCKVQSREMTHTELCTMQFRDGIIHYKCVSVSRKWNSFSLHQKWEAADCCLYRKQIAK